MSSELIYPIYLDIPMMTSFLASIDHGVIEEAEVETKTSETEKKDKKGKLQIGISGIVGMIKASAEGEISKEVSQNLESNYKTNVKFPQAWLFNRLRELLKEADLIKIVETKKHIKEIKIGDIVEFEGLVEPDPTYTLRFAFSQLLPIIEPFLNADILQKELQIEQVNKVNKQNPIELDDGQKIDHNNKHIWKRNLEILLKGQKNNFQLMALMKDTLLKLFPENHSLQNLIVKNKTLEIVAKVYKDYARNETIEDIHHGKWKILGKVISKIDHNNPFDLMKNSPFGLLPQSKFGDILSSLNNESLKLPEIKGRIEEDSLIVAPIGIFI